MKTKLSLVLTLGLLVQNLIAQNPLEKGIWYAFDIKTGREMILTVDESNDSGFKVERKLVEGKKSKKKLSFKERMKKLAEGKPNSKSKPVLHPIEGRHKYTYTIDLRDKEVYTDEFSYQDDLHKVDLEKFYGENSKEANEISKVYGYVYPIGNGFYKDVCFLSGGSYQENESNLEAMFIVGRDRKTTKEKAESLNYSEELKKYYLPDFSTGRKEQPYIKFEDYSVELEIDKKSGEFEFPHFTSAFFLPNKTVEGRQIKFNRSSAFQIELMKDGKIIETKLPRTKKLQKIESQFELGARSVGRLKTGEYNLNYKIYNTIFYKADFEIYTFENPKLDEEIENYYFIRGNRCDYLSVDQKVKREKQYKTPIEFQIDITRMMKVVGKDDDIKKFQAKIFKNGKLYAIMSDQDAFMDGTKNVEHALKVHVTELNVKDYLDLDNGTINTDFLIVNPNSPHDKWLPLDANTITDGNYRIAYFTNNKLYAEANFEVKNKEIVKQGLQIENGTDKMRFIHTGFKIPRVYLPISYK
ncbi:MAG: hypothetical protein ACPG6V_07340 [Flavobacteriales bacterium]